MPEHSRETVDPAEPLTQVADADSEKIAAKSRKEKSRTDMKAKSVRLRHLKERNENYLIERSSEDEADADQTKEL